MHRKTFRKICVPRTSRTNSNQTDAIYLINNFRLATHENAPETKFNLSSCALAAATECSISLSAVEHDFSFLRKGGKS